MSSFSRLAPFVREYIYEKKWGALRDIQEKAAAAVLDGEGHVLIAAATASGKTEAAFFPILSLLVRRKAGDGAAGGGGAQSPGISVLCISPLKALINDQAERLHPLAARAGIPLRRWHGDAPQSGKKKLLEDPEGILQITPESLEALLLLNPGKIPFLFSALAFVVIDEVHAFMGSDRGSQILCQLARIRAAAGEKGGEPRRIGLSASLGDYGEAMRWLSAGSEKNAVLVDDRETKRRLRIGLDYFQAERGGEKDYYGALYRETRGKRSIIFTNSRLEAEETAAALRAFSAERRGGDLYSVHHGSMAAHTRERTERELRESSRPVTTVATATLELGIDTGSLDRIIQIGPPAGVSAFVQRLGRSGRRTGTAEIYFTFLEERREERAGCGPARIPWDLLKTIAVIELYLRDKWIEDAPEQPLPLSLLCHQTLSVLASRGEHTKKALSGLILSFPCFAGVSGEDFEELTGSLIASRVIEETEEGALILGVEGERYTGHYSFYSIFTGSAEYRVLEGERELGKVNYLPPVGSGIILGGISRRVQSVDPRRREIRVVPGEAGSVRVWRGGGQETHNRVARRMKEILEEEEDGGYPYLFPSARSRLDEARRLFREQDSGPLFVPAPGGVDKGISNGADRNGSGGSFFFFPWLGSRAMRTLTLLVQAGQFRAPLGIRSAVRENDFALRVDSALPIPRFREELRNILASPDAPPFPVQADQIPLTGKFDMLLPPRLLVKQYAANMLDWRGTRPLLEIL
ncbi:MAG: DEAD/DEAH box helicase [Treponema sp.]|jgi:ATP-dependent Lhr-like helicase|nr:DEAD/DEAH box helicase [Treponema sp.]